MHSAGPSSEGPAYLRQKTVAFLPERCYDKRELICRIRTSVVQRLPKPRKAGTTASILPSPDGRDAQHRSFGRSQKKMCSGTEPTQSAEYSRILPHHRAAIQTSYMQDSYIGSTAASQAAEAGSTPVSCSKKKCHPTGWHFFLEYGSRRDMKSAQPPEYPAYRSTFLSRKSAAFL